jgi:hypothetical protein
MLLRNSEHRGTATFGSVRDLATGAVTARPDAHRAEFLSLVDAARKLADKEKPDERSARR